MADGPTDSQKPESAAADAADAAMVRKRIDFHLARNPCSSLVKGDLLLETLNLGSDPSRAAVCNAAAGGRLDGGELFDNGGDPELGFGFSFGKIGAGLENLGNTCFLNSVLQCLTYTEPFAAYLQSGKHKTSCQIAGFCAMCAIQKHVMIALQSTGKIVSPYNLVKNLHYISDNFHYSRQEDAHEYMVNLLESMHRCCLPSGFPSESPSAYENSLVHKIFGGRLRSQVKCMQCSYSSKKLDPFLDLSLEIVNVDSLWKALKQFTAVEQLDGGERHYQCQQCKEKVRAVKQLTIHKAPYVLTIHLKRFDSYVPGQKIDNNINFEPTLDLEPFVSYPHGGDLKYTLYGVLVHVGWSTESGHYHCYVRTSTGMWHSLDDNQVYQVSEQTVLEQKAYILFYVRDRSSVVKKSVDSVSKDNVSTNAPGNELDLQFELVSEGAVVDGDALVDGKLFTSEYYSTKLKVATCGSDQTNSISNLLSDGCHAEVKSNAVNFLPRIAVDFNSQKRLEKVLNLPSTHENSDLTIAILHNDDTISNEEQTNLLGDHRPLEILNQSNSMEKIVDHERERCSTNTGCHGEELFKLEETRPIDELKTIACGFDAKCVPTQDGVIYTLAGLKSKKAIKNTLNGIYFGHKQRFLSSVIAHRIRKRNKKKKQTSLHKNAVLGDVVMNDQGASTSEATKNIVRSKCSHRKHSYSSSNRNSTNGVRSTSYCNSEYLDAPNGENVGANGTNSIKHRCNLVDKDWDDSSSLLRCDFMYLLTRGLDQATVSRWDNTSLPENSRRGSHILVEWDKEHDQGQRKSVKKSRQIPGEPGAFQGTPTAKAREKLRSKKRRLQSRPQEKLRVKRRLKKNQQQKKWKAKRWSKNQKR